MIADNWTWWVGASEEWLTTECNSREEAVRIAREEYEGAWIVEALPPAEVPLKLFFDADMFIEDSEDRADDYRNYEADTPVFDVAGDVVQDLQAMVHEAIDAWQAKYGLVFKSQYFAATRNGEWIE